VIGFNNSKESQESLQRLNLMNAIVSRHIGGGFEAFGAVVKEFEMKGIVEQYEFLTLTHILRFFQRLGFEHVNILDESCSIHETHEQPHNTDAPTVLPTHLNYQDNVRIKKRNCIHSKGENKTKTFQKIR
jgi:hypothetical protein